MAAAPGPDPSGVPVPEQLTDAQRSLRAQMLATEHWSLLASRSTTQSEVLTRIAIFLTLVSAGLVTLGLLGNATGFRGWFGVAALGILLLLVVLGFITQLRLFNAAVEDLAHVLAMNRLRGAYLDLDPGLERYFLMGTTDDEVGMFRTYYPFAARNRSQIAASSMMLILVVNAVLVGLLVGAGSFAATGSIGWSTGIGAIALVGTVIGWMAKGGRSYRQALRLHVPLRRAGP